MFSSAMPSSVMRAISFSPCHLPCSMLRYQARHALSLVATARILYPTSFCVIATWTARCCRQDQRSRSVAEKYHPCPERRYMATLSGELEQWRGVRRRVT